MWLSEPGRGIGLVFLILVVAALTGCGSSSTTDASSETIPKAQFIAKADAVCAKNEAKQSALIAAFKKQHPYNGHNQLKEVIEYAAFGPLNKDVTELEELPLPDTDTAEAEEFLDSFKQGMKEVEEDPVSLASYRNSPLEETTEIAEKFGFKICAQS